MKIYIALFTTLIAAGHFTSVSAADATASVDGASHPHLRALADAAVGVACPNGSCKNNNQCDEGSVCEGGSGGGGCTGTCRAGAVTKPPVVSPCPDWECNSNGDGCPSGTTCDTRYSGSIDGCFGCHTGTAY